MLLRTQVLLFSLARLAATALIDRALGPRAGVPTLALALALAGWGAAPPATAQAPAAAPDHPVARLQQGLDVSSHSGAVDWVRLAGAGHTFAFVKATEGVDLEDPAFDAHWRAMKESGLVRGAYHFYVTEDDPREQAEFFIRNVALDPGDLAPVVDVELIGHGTAPGLADRLKVWLEVVEGHYGVKPIIYTAPKFWDAHLSGEFGEYPLWVAEYEVDEPTLPTGWSEWHLWQWKGDAEIAGVEKGADLSRVNRSGPDLTALLVPAPEG